MLLKHWRCLVFFLQSWCVRVLSMQIHAASASASYLSGNSTRCLAQAGV
jgi:hypothetical protein